MRKTNRKIPMIMLMAIMALGLSACGGTSSAAPSGSETSTKTSETTQDKTSTETDTKEVIKEVKAVSDTVTMKVGETGIITNMFNIIGSSSLTSAQKKCTYASSNENVVKIAAKSVRALTVGEATITVTSNIDATKSCTFKITVGEVYFDRSISNVNPGDDFSKELPEDGGTISTGSMVSEELFIKGVQATEFSITTKISFHAVNQTEKFPKMGIIASTESNANADNVTRNHMTFFFNPEMPNNETQWSEFGICEVQNGSNWAWNPSVTNETARHKDDLYVINPALTFDSEFTLTMIRKDFDFHFLVNNTYVGSCVVLKDLFGFYDTATKTYTPIRSYIGFFEFNSDVTFSEYSYETDATKVDSAITGLGTLRYLSDSDWDED